MIFLRHPVTDAGDGVCYGQLDLGLGDGADAQIASALATTPRPTDIRSSDLFRAQMLAEKVAARDGLDITFDKRLREYDFGAWEGRRWSAIPRNDLWGASPPGGENFADLHARVGAAIADCTPRTLVVAHAGVIRAAMMILNGKSFDEVFATKIPFCQPITLMAEAA